MEAMALLPISCFHDIALKCLVFLSYTPRKSSALCALWLRMGMKHSWHVSCAYWTFFPLSYMGEN